MRIDVCFADRVGIAHEILATLARRALDVSAVEVDPPHIYLEAPALSVPDLAALRSEAGFDTQPTSDAVAGTRRNMLEKVLGTERFPFALIRVARADAGRPDLSVAITLHGATRAFEIPAQIETLPRGIAVSGRMTFKQTDFGIAPFSVFGGALRVEDRLDLRFRILATEIGNRPHTGDSHCRPISSTIEQKCTT